MLERIPLAFLAGLVSVITPCVLPLVPGYLSAVSAIEAERLGKPGAARRVALASLPFIAGFTVVFVVLGAGAAAIGGVSRLRPAGRARRLRPRRPRAHVRRPPAVAGAHRCARPPDRCPSQRLERAPRRGLRRLRGALHRHRPRVDPRSGQRHEHGAARRRPARRLFGGARARRSCWRPSPSPRRWAPSAGCATTTT